MYKLSVFALPNGIPGVGITGTKYFFTPIPFMRGLFPG